MRRLAAFATHLRFINDLRTFYSETVGSEQEGMVELVNDHITQTNSTLIFLNSAIHCSFDAWDTKRKITIGALSSPVTR